jgi:antitoxin PrlF
MYRMPIARSKLTSQGQISVPAEIRRKLGLVPGSVLEWNEEGEHVVVRRAGKHSSEDVHRAIFPKGAPKARSIDDMNAGIRRDVRKRHARG